MAAAGAFGVEGMDGAALERRDGILDKAEFVQRVRMDHHLDVVIVGDDRQLSIAAGVVPQSSCSFSAQAPALTISIIAAGREALPLPEMPRLTGKASNDWIIRPMCHGPGVQVVANVPCEGRCRRRASR